ncbi:hypothetical protein V8C35DRAFT_316712 [Trichoderma chlorosporum]
MTCLPLTMHGLSFSELMPLLSILLTLVAFFSHQHSQLECQTLSGKGSNELRQQTSDCSLDSSLQVHAHFFANVLRSVVSCCISQ